MKLFYRFFYSPVVNSIYKVVFRPFRFSLPANMQVPVTGIIRVRDEHTKILFYSNESCAMTRLLFWKDRGFTFEFSAVFKELVPGMQVFMDIGANVGYYSLLGSKLNPEMEIYSLEPSKGPLYFLKKNVELNQLKNIRIIDRAVDKTDGVISFFEEKNLKYSYLEHHASGIGNTINSWGIDNFEKYDVEVVTIDALVASLGIKTLDLIKMDIEGTEDRALEGGLESIRRFQPIIICEVLPGQVGERLERIVVDELEYDVYQFYTSDQKLHRVTSLGQADKTVETNFFFVPKSKISLVQKFIS